MLQAGGGTNPLERLNKEIKRRSDVPRAGRRPPECRLRHLPDQAAVVGLIGALLLEQNDEWAVQRRYMTLETLAAVGDTGLVSLLAVAV